MVLQFSSSRGCPLMNSLEKVWLKILKLKEEEEEEEEKEEKAEREEMEKEQI